MGLWGFTPNPTKKITLQDVSVFYRLCLINIVQLSCLVSLAFYYFVQVLSHFTCIGQEEK